MRKVSLKKATRSFLPADEKEEEQRPHKATQMHGCLRVTRPTEK